MKPTGLDINLYYNDSDINVQYAYSGVINDNASFL